MPWSKDASSPAPSLAMTPEEPGPLKKLGNSVTGVFKRTGDAASGLTKKASKKPVDPLSLDVKAAPPGPEFYTRLAKVREQGGETATAQELYKKALQEDPHYLQAQLGSARLYDRLGRMDEATTGYLEAVRSHPTEASTFNDLALCYARQKKFNESAAALRRAVELRPEFPLYRNNLATVLVEQGRLDEAYQQLATVHGPAVAHYNLGFLLNKRGRPQDALQQFAMAVEKDPTFEPAQQWVESLSADLNGSQIADQGEEFSDEQYADAPPADDQDAIAASEEDRYGRREAMEEESTASRAPASRGYAPELDPGDEDLRNAQLEPLPPMDRPQRPASRY